MHKEKLLFRCGTRKIHIHNLTTVRSDNNCAAGSTCTQTSDMNNPGTQNAFERNAKHIIWTCCSLTSLANGTWQEFKRKAEEILWRFKFYAPHCDYQNAWRLFRNVAAWYGNNLLTCFENERLANTRVKYNPKILYSLNKVLMMTTIIFSISLRPPAFFWAWSS